MPNLVPIKNASVISNAVDEIRMYVLTKSTGHPVPAFSRLSGKWTCSAKRALMRRQQIDWTNYIVSQKCNAGWPVRLTFEVTEDNFLAAFHPVHYRNVLDGCYMKFAVDDGPIRDLTVDFGCPAVQLGEVSTPVFARYLVGGRRLAVEFSGPCAPVVTAVFDITGFEYANYDALRRFVYCNDVDS